MYPQINSEVLEGFDKYGNRGIKVGEILSQFSRNLTTSFITSGAADTTVTSQIFVAPAKIYVQSAKIILDTPNVGSGNVPTFNLKNGSTVIATAEVALSGSVGDVIEMTLSTTSSNLILNENDVLSVDIVTPDQTISTAIIAKVQVEYYFNNL